MNISKNSLTIRNALPDDAKQLSIWRNDGKVMANAGLCTWQTLLWWKNLWEKTDLVYLDIADTLILTEAGFVCNELLF